jgi:hypothetical protein
MSQPSFQAGDRVRVVDLPVGAANYADVLPYKDREGLIYKVYDWNRNGVLYDVALIPVGAESEIVRVALCEPALQALPGFTHAALVVLLEKTGKIHNDIFLCPDPDRFGGHIECCALNMATSLGVKIASLEDAIAYTLDLSDPKAPWTPAAHIHLDLEGVISLGGIEHGIYVNHRRILPSLPGTPNCIASSVAYFGDRFSVRLRTFAANRTQSGLICLSLEQSLHSDPDWENVLYVDTHSIDRVAQMETRWDGLAERPKSCERG